MDEEEGVVMPLYWDCQELRTQLEEVRNAAERRTLITTSIQVCVHGVKC